MYTGCARRDTQLSRTGWCRECGERVQVDEHGSCQNGHGAECLDAVQEAVPVQSGFGVGDMPRELQQFNWGAFTLPLFWALAYGAWPIVSLWLLSLAVPLLLASMAGVDGAAPPLSTIVGIAIVAEVLSGIVRLWAGLNGNRTAWQRERRRLELSESVEPRFTVERFEGRQRTWARFGWPVLVAAAFGTAYVNAAAWAQYDLSLAGAAEPFVWLTAQILLGLWLASKARQEFAESTA